jgi:hypothetical protein
MKLAHLGLVLVIGSVSWMALAADKDSPKDKTAAGASGEKPEAADKWMKVKLHSSQEIFAGLTNGNLKAVEVNAGRMLLMNALEEWKKDTAFTRHSDYDAQLNAFEFATKELIRTARHNDMDGALDAYIAMSKSCVKCHQIIRDVPSAATK